MPTGRAGQFNTSGLTNPGAYLINNLPSSNAVGVPTNIEAMVGVGSWGPTNALIVGTNQGDCATKLGLPQVRFADIATHVEAAAQMGSAINFRWVRVTDGTDTAAYALVQSSAGQATARYSGTMGNNVTLAFNMTTRVGAYKAVVLGPTGLPEQFDNIATALQSVTVTPGTGYSYVPAATVSAPQVVGGSAATVQPTLTSVTQTILAGGTGHAVNDVVTFGAGVQIKVLTLTGSAIATFSVVNSGSITSGSVPSTVGAQTATTGSGTGASLTLLWGLGAPTFTYGSGYYSATGSALTLALQGGGSGTGFTAGTYTPVMSFWAALASAINLGTTQRGRSQFIVFSPGTSTAAPVLGTPITFAGGTDGAGGVGTLQLVGNDGLANARTGMYSLRGSGMDTFELCDCVDTAPWGVMLSLAIGEASYAIAAAPLGLSIESSVALRQTAGVDDPQFKLLTGDWPSFFDTYYGTRTVSPCAIFAGLCGNLSPEQGTINKPLPAVTRTGTSQLGIVISSNDESYAETGGVDVIGQSDDLGETYFSFLTGRNSSSNTIANGDEYTRLTNYFIRTLEQVGKQFVGDLQSQQFVDPTRVKALQTFDSFCQTQVNPSSGSNGYGKIQGFLNICDLTNNSPATIQGGYMFMTTRLQYLSVVRYFVTNLFGGSNVTTTVQTALTQQTV